MLTNKIQLPYTTNLTNDHREGILNVLAFADDISTSIYYNDLDASNPLSLVEVSSRYLPEGVSFSTTDSDTNFYIAVSRQDKKTIPLVPLSTAVFGQGMVINESQFGGSAETYFLNSFRVKVSTDVFRVGVSNFTQTQDNNPFSSLGSTQILYFEV
jgi:hypothetical protein